MNQLAIIILKTTRKLYKQIIQTKEWHLKPSESIHDAQSTSNKIKALLEGNTPCMVARYGSTELACISNYLSITNKKHSVWNFITGKEAEWWWNPNIMEQMKRWSGFFPPTKENLTQFCQLMLEDTKQLDALGQWVYDEWRLGKRLDNVFKTHLQYLEPFWCEHPWTSALKGKNVVVVHPFSQLIEEQYREKREKLFANPEILPEFNLRTVQAVQSLGGENNGFSDWFTALEWMKQEIDKESYDICLLGCGAYGFPLAAHVKRQGKKAIHLGGSLQLLFGIIGSRWENPNYGVKEWGIPYGSYSSLINEYWTRPGKIGRPRNAKQVEGGCYW